MIPVFVDGALPDDPTTLALISACSQVVRPDSCVLGSEDTALARVYWPGPLRAEIQVDSGSHHEDRIIEFQSADLPKARWQAAGLIAGSLLQDVQGTAHAPSPKNPTLANRPEGAVISNAAAGAATASSAPPPPPPPSQSVTRRPLPQRQPLGTGPNQKPLDHRQGPAGIWRDLGLFAGLGALTGLGLTPNDSALGPARVGGWAQLELRAWQGFGMAALAQISVTAKALSGVDGRWRSIAFGPSYAHRLSPRITVLMLAALAGEDLRLRLEPEQHQHTYWGWLVAAGVEGRLTTVLTLTGQVAVLYAPEQPVRIAGTEVGQQSQFSPFLLAGARLRLF